MEIRELQLKNLKIDESIKEHIAEAKTIKDQILVDIESDETLTNATKRNRAFEKKSKEYPPLVEVNKKISDLEIQKKMNNIQIEYLKRMFWKEHGPKKFTDEMTNTLTGLPLGNTRVEEVLEQIKNAILALRGV